MTLCSPNGREVSSGSTLQLSTVLYCGEKQQLENLDFSCLGFWPILPLGVSSSLEEYTPRPRRTTLRPFHPFFPSQTKPDPVEPQAGTVEESSPNLFPSFPLVIHLLIGYVVHKFFRSKSVSLDGVRSQVITGR